MLYPWLVTIGAKVVRHSHLMISQIAEVVVPRAVSRLSSVRLQLSGCYRRAVAGDRHPD